MDQCLSTASLSRLTLLISSVYRLEEKARPWAWAAQLSFTLYCRATSLGSSGTGMVSSLQLLYWFYWDNCKANRSTSYLLTPSDVLLSPSKWHQMHWAGDRATLTLTHLNKEDEGLYTLRVTTKSGYETYSAYVFVRGIAMITMRCLFLVSTNH